MSSEELGQSGRLDEVRIRGVPRDFAGAQGFRNTRSTSGEEQTQERGFCEVALRHASWRQRSLLPVRLVGV